MNIFEKTDFTGDKPSVVSIKKTDKVNLFTVWLIRKASVSKAYNNYSCNFSFAKRKSRL